MVKLNKKGEEEIAKLLLEHKILFSRNVKLFLKGDEKKYRVPDFYLHKYNLVIEYFGSWDYSKSIVFKKKERQRFLKKINAYAINHINCIFIYPNELDSSEEIILSAIKEIEINKKNVSWVLPWYYEDKVNPPKKEDFKEKEEPLNWVLPWLYEKKIEEPKAEDFLVERVEPLNWNISWLKENKIEEPRADDFLEKEVSNQISFDPEPMQINSEPSPSTDNNEEKHIPIIGFILIVLIIVLILLFLIAIFFGR